MEELISEKLLLCGFKPSHFGYRYVRECVKEYITSNLDADLLGHKLYEKISEREGGKSPKTIEKNIKCAIDFAYSRGNRDYLKKYFMHEKGALNPTPCEFIAMVANHILFCDRRAIKYL